MVKVESNTKNFRSTVEHSAAERKTVLMVKIRSEKFDMILVFVKFMSRPE